MSEPVKIVITLDGGLVQAVVSDGTPVEYVVIDYDTEGGDENDMLDVPQDDGSTTKAWLSGNMAEVDKPWVDKVYEAVRQFNA